MEGDEGGLTLELVFKAAGIMGVGGGLLGIAMPELWAENVGWVMTEELENLSMWVGFWFIMFGLLMWNLPSLAADNLSTWGRYAAGFFVVALALNIYEIASGVHEWDQTLLNTVPNVIFAALFYMKSQ